jgi:hypothetical protein
VVRGIPVVYVNYIGYDIVAHHAGPHTFDAMSTLGGIDRQIRKIHRTISKKAPRHYDLVVLSDHGQTKSIPFSKLYGQTVAGLIEGKLKTPSSQTGGYSPESTYLSTLLSEMALVENAFAPPRLVKSRRRLEQIRSRVWAETNDHVDQKGIVVCCSGNLAHVYFSESPGRVTMERLLKFMPTFIDVLVSHPGIGFVVTTNETGEIFVIGKHGLHRLRSGEVEGEDPLLHYGNGDNLKRELTLLCEYPSSGDVIINGALLADKTVVTFEEQIGTHGGAGGPQTEPFIIFPEHFDGNAPDIRSPEEMHRFLMSQTGRKRRDHTLAERSGEK